LEGQVKYLVDTNVWLERLLGQEKSEVAAKFLSAIPTDRLFLSDFAIHSIGVILSRLERFDVFEKFVDDLFTTGQIGQLSLEASELTDVITNIRKYGLDFDDAYQLCVARKYNLTIVTFDKDFNVDGISRNSPDEIVG